MQRSNLSHDAAKLLREQILSGELDAGDRINEVHLAARLEVSRTPLREALGILVAEEFLIHRPRRGYFVRPLDLDEFDQLYAMRAILDPEALRMAGLPSKRQIDELRLLNGEIRRAIGDPARVIELDDAWHLKLIDHCPNRILLDTIRHFMLRTRRYEHAYMRSGAHVEVALADHGEILAGLDGDDLPRACRGLRANMQSACEPLRRWLQERTR
ncbi:MAG: GntR family transcriptional regulator [Acidobacteriota bacterium]